MKCINYIEMEKQTLILTKSKLNFKGSYLKDLGLFYLVEVVYHKKKIVYSVTVAGCVSFLLMFLIFFLVN